MKNLIRAGERGDEHTFRHPLEPTSEARGVGLSSEAGLQRVGVNLLRLAPGRCAFPCHAHAVEEEWMVVLSGRGVADIGDESHEIGPGDFLAFAPPGPAHQVKNPFDEDLVYLSGGEHGEVEIGSFPRHHKRILRVGDKVTTYPLDGDAFPGFEKF